MRFIFIFLLSLLAKVSLSQVLSAGLNGLYYHGFLDPSISGKYYFMPLTSKFNYGVGLSLPLWLDKQQPAILSGVGLSSTYTYWSGKKMSSNIFIHARYLRGTFLSYETDAITGSHLTITKKNAIDIQLTPFLFQLGKRRQFSASISGGILNVFGTADALPYPSLQGKERINPTYFSLNLDLHYSIPL